jgi:glyoxylase-like metal-dependent hydrolase (beta-lactamase superfamily II)
LLGARLDASSNGKPDFNRPAAYFCGRNCDTLRAAKEDMIGRSTSMVAPRTFIRTLSALVVVLATAQIWPNERVAAQGMDMPMIPENAVQRVSDHVSAIMAWPNIVFVVGNRATLVVDTGMGARNGATVLREAQKLSKNQAIYLTTTHFHPEHSSGASAFPPGVILVRNRAQQEELNAHGAEYVALFGSRNPLIKDLLSDYKDRPPDMVYDNEMTLDLGGVTARLFYLGAAHTVGDELISVLPDNTLITGDVVQNKQTPNMPNDFSSPRSWIAILDKLEALKPRYIVPDHGPLGDGSLIAQERAFLVALQTRTLELKKSGKSADETAKMITDEFKVKYPDWTGINNAGNGARRVYAQSE